MELKVNIRQLCILTSSCSARDVTASPWLRCEKKNFSNSFQPANAMIQISCNESFYLMFLKEKVMEWWKKWWKTHFSTTDYGPLVRSFNALQPPSSRIWFKRHLIEPNTRPTQPNTRPTPAKALPTGSILECCQQSLQQSLTLGKSII